jgi:hypothetical protein
VIALKKKLTRLTTCLKEVNRLYEEIEDNSGIRMCLWVTRVQVTKSLDLLSDTVKCGIVNENPYNDGSDYLENIVKFNGIEFFKPIK